MGVDLVVWLSAIPIGLFPRGKQLVQNVKVNRLCQMVIEAGFLRAATVFLLPPAGQGDQTMSLPPGCSRMRVAAS